MINHFILYFNITFQSIKEVILTKEDKLYRVPDEIKVSIYLNESKF